MMVWRSEVNEFACAVPTVPAAVITGTVAPFCSWVLDCRKSAMNALWNRPRKSPVVNWAICSVANRLCELAPLALNGSAANPVIVLYCEASTDAPSFPVP